MTYSIENNINMIKFFEITYSVDEKIMGSESQINDFFDRSNFTKQVIDLYQDNRKNTFINDQIINLHNFSLDKKSKQTDILSSDYLKLDGFFISEKFREVIENAIAHRFRVLDTTLYKKGEKIDNYFFLNIINTDSIDYKKSSFRVDASPVKWRDGGKEIEINNEDDLFSKNWEVIMDDPTMKILPKKAILKEYVDIIKLANSNSIYFSEHLKQKIEEKKLTGVVFEETDIEFYLDL